MQAGVPSNILGDCTNSTRTRVFNRNDARAELLKATRPSSSKTGEAANKLLETLKHINISGARRVAVNTNNADATPIPSVNSLTSSEWETEKRALLAEIATLKKKIDDQAASASVSAQWQDEKSRLESALRVSESALDSARARCGALESQTLELSARVAALEAELTKSNQAIAQMQREKRTLDVDAEADTDVDETNHSVDDDEDDTAVIEFAPKTKVAASSLKPAASTLPAAFDSTTESVEVSALSPSSPSNDSSATQSQTRTTLSPLPLPPSMCTFSPLSTEPLVPSASDDHDDFAPVTAEEMEASLSSAGGDDFLNASASEADQTSASLNLSVNSSMMSPSGMKLPASFQSPKDEHEGAVLSPIARAISPHGSASTSKSQAALSASARKIQALFRGRMERGYLAQESRLASLPLTSPSTPTPNAKRQRVKKLRSPSIILRGEIPEEIEPADAIETKPPRALSFQDENEEGESISAVTTPTSSSSSTSLASATPSVSPVPSADSKRYASEFRACRATLSSLDACWTIRSKSMNRLEELCRERGPHGFGNWMSSSSNGGSTGWKEELALLQRPMAVQLGDLRSSILREACRLLIAMAEASPRDFEEQLPFYYPILCKSLYVTIKIISTTADETIVELVSRVATVKSIPTVRLAIM